MQRQPNKLWRKIGLQKNFLQGTSHSDLSRLSDKNSIDQSPIPSKREPEDNDQYGVRHQKMQRNQFLLMRKVQEKRDLQYVVSKSENDSEVVESPIGRLDFSDFENNCSEWEKNISNRPGDKNHVDKNVQLLLEMGKSQNQPSYQHDQFEDDSQYKSSDFEPSIKKSLCMNSVVSVQINHLNQYVSQFLHPPKHLPLHVLHSSSEKNIECKMISSREYEFEEGFVEMRKRESVQSQVIEVVECMDVKEMGMRGKGNSMMMNEVMRKVRIFKQAHRQYILQIRDRLKSFRQYFSCSIRQWISQKLTQDRNKVQQLQHRNKVQQLNQQVSYLYEQNKQLMVKLQQKQLFIKKTSQQVQRMAQTLSTIKHNKLSQQQTQSIDNQKDSMIQRQQNQINRLYEKMEDLDELQTSNQFLKRKIHQLEEDITKGVAIEWELKKELDQVNTRCDQFRIKLQGLQHQTKSKNLLIDQLTAKQLKLQHQLQSTYLKLDQLHFHLNGQYTKQLQTQQQQFLLKIKQQKDKFNQQLLAIKQQIRHSTHIEYQAVIQELANKIKNKLQIQKIIKHFQFTKTDPIIKLLTNTYNIPDNTNHHKSLTQNFNKKLPIIIDDSLKLAQHPDSDHEQSPTKNLKRTGFFGQASASHANIINSTMNHPIVEPNSYDVTKRYNTERSEFNEELAQYKTMYQTLTYKDKYKKRNTSKSRSPQDHSQKSYSSLFKDQQPSKSKQLALYNHDLRIRQRSNSSGWSPKRQSSEIFPYIKNLGINDDQNMLKASHTKKQYLTSNDGHDISFTNSQNHYFDDPIKQKHNERPQFSIKNLNLNSPSHSLPFETSYAKTTYFKSQKYSPQKRDATNVFRTNYVRYKPQNNVKRQRDEVDEVDDIVDKIKQKISEKFKYQRKQSPMDGNSFKATLKSSSNNSPVMKNPSSVNVSPQKHLFEKQSKNYSYAHSTLIPPSRTLYIQQIRNRSKSQNRSRLKSPSLDNKLTSPIITPRGSVSNFQKVNNLSRQVHTTSFAKHVDSKDYSRVSPSSKRYEKQPLISNYQLRISPNKNLTINQTQRDSFQYFKR